MKRTTKKGNHKSTRNQKCTHTTPPPQEEANDASTLRTITLESITQACTPARKSTRIRKGNPRYSEQSQLGITPPYPNASILSGRIEESKICTNKPDQTNVLKTPEGNSKGKEIMFPLEGHIHVDSEDDDVMDTSNVTFSSSKVKTPTTTPQKRRLAKLTISDDEASPENTTTENGKLSNDDTCIDFLPTKTRRRLRIENTLDELDSPQEPEEGASKDLQITTLEMANPNQINPIFEGRITGKWCGHLFGAHNPKLMMMTIMDNENNEMQVNVDNKQIEKWNNEITIGIVYRIRNATITKSESKYKSTPHQYSMAISSETVIEKIEEPNTIPFERYYLRTLEELNMALVAANTLIDVVGRVAKCERCRPITTKFGMTNICGMYINDESKKITKITLWGGVAAEYGNRMHGVENDHPTILATKLIVKYYRGNYCLDSTSFTKIILQPKDFTPTAEEKTNYSDIEENIGKLGQQNIYCTTEEQITIAMLQAESSNTIQEMKIYSICASIASFDLNYSIWYPACHSCYCHYKIIGENKKCNKCNVQPSNTIQRPRIRLEASDETGRIDITLFGNDAETAMGVPLTKLLSTCEKCKETTRRN